MLTAKILNRSRRLLGNGVFRDSDGEALPVQYTGVEASRLIHDYMVGDQPCMVSRMGRTELETIRRFWFGYEKGWMKNALGYVTGRHGAFWWDPIHLEYIRIQSGFFPNDAASVESFSRRYFEDMPQIDILGAWCEGESDLTGLLGSAKVVGIEDLEPFFQAEPWTRALEGKRVLVIHPFARSIERQYEKRGLLFANPAVLPDFELRAIPAVQSLGGENAEFKSWFEALEWMSGEMEKQDFDVLLVGAGAYGLPLAAKAKRMGRKAVHLGGALQLLFGIRGKRWDERPKYQELCNEHWIRPDVRETPKKEIQIEGGCYW